MTKTTPFLIGCCMIIISLLPSCNADVTPPLAGCDTAEATYNTNVKQIIDATCAYGGCHDGSGSAPGHYGTFEGLKSILQNGEFTSRVIDLRINPSLGMPPNQDIYPNSQQDDLSEEQLEIIQCWVDSGMQE